MLPSLWWPFSTYEKCFSKDFKIYRNAIITGIKAAKVTKCWSISFNCQSGAEPNGFNYSTRNICMLQEKLPSTR